jgi:hypothetical protein
VRACLRSDVLLPYSLPVPPFCFRRNSSIAVTTESMRFPASHLRRVIDLPLRVPPEHAILLAIFAAIFGEARSDVLDSVQTLLDRNAFLSYIVRARRMLACVVRIPL